MRSEWKEGFHFMKHVLSEGKNFEFYKMCWASIEGF